MPLIEDDFHIFSKFSNHGSVVKDQGLQRLNAHFVVVLGLPIWHRQVKLLYMVIIRLQSTNYIVFRKKILTYFFDYNSGVRSFFVDF